MRTRAGLLALAAIVFPALPTSSARAGEVPTIGVLGDSYSDEYQFYAPHRAAARNWVEILAGTHRADFGPFQAESRGEPRNSGYAYNWARSGATSGDMIASGQHTGLAQQVARGEVEIAVVFVGGNDFIESLHEPDPRSALEGRGCAAASNVRLAVETLLAASPGVRVVMATVPDVRELPEFRDPLRSGAMPRELADRATGEIDAFNAQIRALAASSGGRASVCDLARITMVAKVVSPRAVYVAGRRVDRDRPGDDPDRLFLGDTRHLGTIGQAMIARFLVDCLNARCQAAIRPLDDREIVALVDARSPASSSVATIPVAEAARRHEVETKDPGHQAEGRDRGPGGGD